MRVHMRSKSPLNTHPLVMIGEYHHNPFITREDYTMKIFKVPFDHNLAERDLPERGACNFCRIHSYNTMARNNGVRVLGALRNAVLGEPFYPIAWLSGPRHQAE